MPSTLHDLQVDFVSFVDRAAVRDSVQQSEPMRFLLTKAEQQGLVVWKRDHNNNPGDPMSPEEKAALEKAQADEKAATERATKAEADLAATKTDLTKAQEQIEALTKSVDEIKEAAGIKDEPVALDKSELSPAMRAHVEKMEADQAALAERVAKAEQDAADEARVAKAERDERLTREFVGKAESYKSLSQKPAEFGPVLKAASEKLTKDEYAEIERVLTAADNALHTAGVFAEQGRSGDGPQGDDTAIAKATKAAAEIRKNDSSITPAGALQQVFKADPELASRYQDEVRAAA